jgi:hypothetical protein
MTEEQRHLAEESAFPCLFCAMTARKMKRERDIIINTVCNKKDKGYTAT